MSTILSVCIGTYDRVNDLKELVLQILESTNKHFLVEITENGDSDQSVSMLRTINDSRIRTHREPEINSGKDNIVASIFNCSSKYALYINDRELFDGNKIDELIRFLEENDYAYIYLPSWKCFGKESKDITEYEKGSATLLRSSIYNEGIRFAHHPSGMIYNCDLIRDHLKREDYFSFEGSFPHSMIACDLCQLGASAIFDLRIWAERSKEYKINNIARCDLRADGNGQMTFFGWKMQEINLKETINHLIIRSPIGIQYSKNEAEVLLKRIIEFFFDLLPSYKIFMYSKEECCHYRIRKRFVTTGEMINIYNHFHHYVASLLSELDISRTVEDWWGEIYFYNLIYIIKNSFKSDVRFIIPDCIMEKIHKWRYGHHYRFSKI